MSAAPAPSPGLPDDEGFDPVDPIEAAATAWLARRDRGLTPAEVVEFARWRATDPRHEAAVVDLGAMWSALDDLSALRGKAPLSQPEFTAPASAAKLPGQDRAGATAPGIFPAWAWAIAACLALMVGVIAWQRTATGETTATRYETAVGERRTLTLPDGSTLQLNTYSSAEVRYTADGRRVELVRGEAYFKVTKDAQRPFVVRAGGVEARALGTAFVVRRREQETELVVTEGRVKFGVAEVSAVAAEVAAGERAICDPKNVAPPVVERLDAAALARHVAWQGGMLICRKDMPLAEAVAEFNRYHRAQLVLRDGAAAVPIGGGFELANLDAFVRLLESESFDLVVVERSAERIVLTSKR